MKILIIDTQMAHNKKQLTMTPQQKTIIAKLIRMGCNGLTRDELLELLEFTQDNNMKEEYGHVVNAMNLCDAYNFGKNER